jgi:hypothetical protein
MRTVLLPLAFSGTLALGGMPLAVASGDACNGASAGLAPSECSAWASFFDSTNGTQWTNCYDSRLDPCGCIYDPDTYTRGIHCSADGIHITYMDLFHNNLCGVIPEAISALTGLTLLVLHVNQLTGSIPQGLSALTSLNALNLHDNSLSGSIPGGLTALNGLTDLRLYRNRLTGLVPDLPFKSYTIRCDLQKWTTAAVTNHFTCPLPPVSPRVRCMSRIHAPRTVRAPARALLPRTRARACLCSLAVLRCRRSAPNPLLTPSCRRPCAPVLCSIRQDAALCAYGPPKNCVPVPAEQAAWESLYDGTGGATQWTNCGANRQDPCGCSYGDGGNPRGVPRGVTCSADGQHILEL